MGIVATVLAEVSAEISAQIVLQGREAPKVYIMPGQDIYVPGGDEEGCSSLVATLVDGVAVDNFPEAAPANCVWRPAYILRFGVYRCIPLAEDFGGEDPPADVLNAATIELLNDAEAIICGIRKALNYGGYSYLVERYTPVGPEGGIAGGHWTVLIDSQKSD